MGTQYRTQNVAKLASSPRPATGDVSPSDLVLLCGIRDADQTAIASLYERHSRLAYSIALRVLRDHALAEDALHDIFLKIWRNPPALDPAHSDLRSWLAVVTRNHAIDVLRRTHINQPLEGVVIASSYNLGRQSENHLLGMKAAAIIETLPADQRKVMEMAFFDGLTQAEISELTGVPLGTVKTRTRAAIASLRKGFQHLRTDVPCQLS
jgi:RNA polymerase sigma-70 factor (ECF subfamily)